MNGGKTTLQIGEKPIEGAPQRERSADECLYEREGVCFEIDVLAFFYGAIGKGLVDQIGLLDERFEVGIFEDDDYALRIKQKGYKLICAEDVFIHHHGMAAFEGLGDKEYKEILYSVRIGDGLKRNGVNPGSRMNTGIGSQIGSLRRRL